MSQHTSGPQFQLAHRLDGVSESATLKLNAAVQAMKAQGVDVINLTAGEPDFNVPAAAKKAVLQAVEQNRSKYTPAAGILELRNLIVQKTNAQQPSVSDKNPWKATDVVVTNGGKQAIFNAFLALLNPGDEVLVPSPYWLSYPEMIKLTGAKAVFIPTTVENEFKITPAQLKAALTPRTRLLIVNSPSNPTGMVYSKAEFTALGRVLSETAGAEGVWVLSDEIYDRINFGRIPFCSFLESSPQLHDRTVTVNGLSKSAAMTGWRVGWSVAPSGLTQGMITLQGQSTSGINSLAQAASVAALQLPESDFAEQIATYRRRRDLTLEILGKAGKLEVAAPEGAFYVFIGVKGYLKAGEDSFSFAEAVLEKSKVAVVPGAPFGAPEFIRISFALEEKALRAGCERLVEFLLSR
ncbi:MAG: pyridoxal phosphate-dependent aminotransferase [Methylotenera sp.]|nr:pyridoxal phosphate-dependent aminotransferase [Oligoflexia bacterium]